jgi:hypothetical protein
MPYRQTRCCPVTGKGGFLYRCDLMPLAVGDGQKGRQRPRVVIETVHLDGALGLPELRPGKNRQAQINGGRVDRIEGVCEPEPVAGSDPCTA